MPGLKFFFPFTTTEGWVLHIAFLIGIFGFFYCVLTKQFKLRDGLAGVLTVMFIIYIAGRMMGWFRW